MQSAAPLAVVVTVEAEVETEAEVHARVAERGDGHCTVATVGHHEVQRPAEHTSVARVICQIRTDVLRMLDLTIRMLDRALEPSFLVPEGTELAQLMMDRVVLTVAATQQHRAPREPEGNTGYQPARRLDVGEGNADVVADPP